MAEFTDEGPTGPGPSPEQIEQVVTDEQPVGDAAALPAAEMESLLAQVPLAGPRRHDSLTAQIASLRGSPTDPIALSSAEIEMDGDSVLAIESDAVYDELQQEVADAAINAVEVQNIDGEAVVGAMNEANTVIHDLRTSPVSQEWAMIKKVASGPIDRELHQEIALSLANANSMAKMVDAMGGWDYVSDFGGLVVPLRETLMWEQIKSGVKGNDSLSTYITGDNIEGMITSWQSMPVERKIALHETLIKTIVESIGISIPLPFGMGQVDMDSNTLLAVSALMRFFQPEGGLRAKQEQRVGLAIDVVDLGATAVAAVAKTLKASQLAAKARKPGELVPEQTPPIVVDSTLAGAQQRFAPVPTKAGVQADAKATGKTARKEAAAEGASKKAAREIGKEARKAARAEGLAALPVEARQMMEAIMLTAASRAARQNSIPAILARAGDTKQAVAINLSAMTNLQVAKAYGISSDAALANVMPMQTAEWMPQVIEGLIPETAKAVNGFLMESERKVRSMTTHSDLFRLGVLDQNDRTRVTLSFLDEMEHIGEDMLMEGITLSNVKVLDDTLVDGFEFEYTITRSSGATPETIKGRRTWRINQATGNFTETVKSLQADSIFNMPGVSPKGWSVTKEGQKRDFNDTVGDAIALQDVVVAAQKRIRDLFIDASDSISGVAQGNARKRVDAVELAGDAYVNPGTPERGKVFTPRELGAGIKVNAAPGEEAIVYLTDPREVEAYYKRRLVADSFSAMQNFVTRRQKEIEGMKMSHLTTGGNEYPVMLKPFDNANSAKGSVRGKQGFEMYDQATGEVVQITDDLIDAAYDEGKVLARMDGDWNVSGNQDVLGGHHVEYALIDKSAIKSLPDQVVNYKSGYVPKINQGIEVVVKQLFPYKKAGKSGLTKSKALRAFSSKKEADQFIAIMAKRYAAKQGISEADALLRFDKADGSVMAQVERMDMNLSGSAGLFTGTRAQDDILMGLDGVEIERLSAAESYGRYVDHLGTQVSTNEWRMGQQQQWINTVRAEFPGIKITGFEATKIPGDTPKGDALLKLRRQIQQWGGIPTRKESLYQSQVQNFHDWALDAVGKKPGLARNAISNILYLKHSNPDNAVMTATMHLLLGTWNFSQIFVQGVTSVVALSLRPIAEIPNIIGTVGKFALLDNIRDPGALSKVMGRMKGQSTAGDTDEAYMMWRRSGLYDSIRSNADMNEVTSTGLGMTANFMRKAETGSLALYRTGELLNRRVSFIAAFNTIKKQNKLRKLDDNFLEETIKLANKTMLELNAANKAWWQGGRGATSGQKVAKVATQFLQVGAKTAELTLKGVNRGGFTKAQKARIVMGQVLMFGAKGFPPLAIFGPQAVDLIAAGMGLDDNDDEDIQTKAAIANAYNQGMIGVIAKEGFGADIELSNRTAVLASISDTAWDIITGEDPMYLRLLGASGTIADRALTAWKDLPTSQALDAVAELAGFSMADRTNTTPWTIGKMKATVAEMALIMATIPSSARGALKAYVMYNHNRILSAKGQLVTKDDFNASTAIGVLMGFQDSKSQRVNAVDLDVREHGELIKEASDVIVRAYHRLAFLHNNDPDQARAVGDLVQFIQEGLNNKYLVEKLRNSLVARLRTEPKSKEEKALAEYFKIHMEGKVAVGAMIDQGFSSMVNGLVVLPFADTVKPKEDK